MRGLRFAAGAVAVPYSVCGEPRCLCAGEQPRVADDFATQGGVR